MLAATSISPIDIAQTGGTVGVLALVVTMFLKGVIVPGKDLAFWRDMALRLLENQEGTVDSVTKMTQNVETIARKVDALARKAGSR